MGELSGFRKQCIDCGAMGGQHRGHCPSAEASPAKNVWQDCGGGVYSLVYTYCSGARVGLRVREFTRRHQDLVITQILCSPPEDALVYDTEIVLVTQERARRQGQPERGHGHGIADHPFTGG